MKKITPHEEILNKLQEVIKVDGQGNWKVVEHFARGYNFECQYKDVSVMLQYRYNDIDGFDDYSFEICINEDPIVENFRSDFDKAITTLRETLLRLQNGLSGFQIKER